MIIKGKAKKDSRALKNAIKGRYEPHFPGPIHVVGTLVIRYRFRTIPEIGTDKEPIYYFNGQIYERAEELIKSESHREYIDQWESMLQISNDEGLNARLKNALNNGPSTSQIQEVLSMIRRTTFTEDEMNPSSHIPFKNGLLNIKEWRMEPFTPDLFFTYQVDANLLDRYLTLEDIPKFSYLLKTAFFPKDIPMILSYFAYSFYPDLPVHKVLFVLGRQRIGKGTSVRVIQGLMPKGSGSISLARLLTSERFPFTGIDGKNLLIDSETKRKFRRGTVLEWSAFCNLFGKDVLSVEPKGHEAHDYVSKAKGIFLGNLPFVPVDSPPAISRILLVVTRDEAPRKVIPDLDKRILNTERDLIATLLMQILFRLIGRNFVFPNKISDDETAQILDKLADPVENFIEEEAENDEGSVTPVEIAYARFREWCNTKGIPEITRQTFVKKFGHEFQKKRIGPRGRQEYVFTNCRLSVDDLEVNEKNIEQVGYGFNYGETPKLTAFEDGIARIQHEYYNPSHVDEKNIEYNKKDSVQKMDTNLLSSGSLEKLHPPTTKPVSNFQCNFVRSISENGKEKKPEPVLITVRHENSKAYRYIAIKDFSMYGHEYKAGIEFEHLQLLEEYVKIGTLKIIVNEKHSSNCNDPDIKSITEAQAKEFIETLLNKEFYIIPRDSGLTFDKKEFKIAVVQPHSPQKREELFEIMSSKGFKKANTGTLGPLFFKMQVRSDKHEK